MKNLSLPVATVAGFLAAGCSSSGDATSGELSRGAFTYVCTETADATCSTAGGTSALPANGVAVGSRFEIRYTGDQPETEDGVSFQVQVVPASPSMVESDGSGLRATGAGHIAFLGRGANGVVADFVHVRAVEIGDIEVSRSGVPVSSLAIDTSSSVTLAAAPLGDSGQTLGGGLAYTWASSDESVLGLTGAFADDEISLEGKQAGAATLTVTAGGFSRTVAVTVEAP